MRPKQPKDDSSHYFFSHSIKPAQQSLINKATLKQSSDIRQPIASARKTSVAKTPLKQRITKVVSVALGGGGDSKSEQRLYEQIGRKILEGSPPKGSAETRNHLKIPQVTSTQVLSRQSTKRHRLGVEQQVRVKHRVAERFQDAPIISPTPLGIVGLVQTHRAAIGDTQVLSDYETQPDLSQSNHKLKLTSNATRESILKLARTYATKQHPYRTSIDLMTRLEQSAKKRSPILKTSPQSVIQKTLGRLRTKSSIGSHQVSSLNVTSKLHPDAKQNYCKKQTGDLGDAILTIPQSAKKIRVSMSPALKLSQPLQKFAIRNWLDDFNHEGVTIQREPQDFDFTTENLACPEYYVRCETQPSQKQMVQILNIEGIVKSILSFFSMTETITIEQVNKGLFKQSHSKSVTKQQRYLIVNIGLTRVERLRLWYNKGSIIHFKHQQTTRFPNLFRRLAKKKNEWTSEIKIDAERTFPHLQMFNNPQAAQLTLIRILNAVANYFPDLGYVQGMNFIVASLLLNLVSEEDTFYMTIQILKHNKLRDMYLRSFRRLKILCFQLDSFIQAYIPQLHSLLQQEGIDSEYFATRWFLTLFTYDLSIENISTVLDLFMVEGFKCLIKLSLAILSHAFMLFEQAIIRGSQQRLRDITRSSQNEIFIGIIKSLSDEIKLESHQLLTQAQSFKVTSKLMKDMENLYHTQQRRASLKEGALTSRCTTGSGWEDLGRLARNYETTQQSKVTRQNRSTSLKNRMILITKNQQSKKHEWLLLPQPPSKIISEHEEIMSKETLQQRKKKGVIEQTPDESNVRDEEDSSPTSSAESEHSFPMIKLTTRVGCQSDLLSVLSDPDEFTVCNDGVNQTERHYESINNPQRHPYVSKPNFNAKKLNMAVSQNATAPKKQNFNSLKAYIDKISSISQIEDMIESNANLSGISAVINQIEGCQGSKVAKAVVSKQSSPQKKFQQTAQKLMVIGTKPNSRSNTIDFNLALRGLISNHADAQKLIRVGHKAHRQKSLSKSSINDSVDGI